MDSLNKLTVVKLRKLCRDEQISDYTRLKKRPLIRHIKTYRTGITIKEGLAQLIALE